MTNASEPMSARSASRQKMVRERRSGNSVVAFGCVSLAFVLMIGISIDVSRIASARHALQARLDRALTAATRASGNAAISAAEGSFDAAPQAPELRGTRRHFTADAVGYSGVAVAAVPTTLSSLVGLPEISISARGAVPAPHL